ncbi:MAG: hypothetical protein ACKODX_05035 [Gemmata sp.]
MTATRPVIVTPGPASRGRGRAHRFAAAGRAHARPGAAELGAAKHAPTRAAAVGPRGLACGMLYAVRRGRA